MKNYNYEIIKHKNKSLLMVEMIFNDLSFETVNVYPIVRLTHYRYVLTQRINSISDYLYDQITSGKLSPLTRISNILSIQDVRYAKNSIQHIHIFYAKRKSLVIAEYDWMYMCNNSTSKEAFKILKAENKKHPDTFKYCFAGEEGEITNYTFHRLDNISMRDYNHMKVQRIYRTLHRRELLAI